MDLNEYQRLAMRTNGTPKKSYLTTGINAQLLNAVLGATGEAGELADDVKKSLFHGKPFDRDHALKEIGDIMWYAAQAADALDATLEEVGAANIEKLKKRYPEGFSHAASAARVDTLR